MSVVSSCVRSRLARKDLLVVLATERAELERLLLGHRLQVEASLRRLAAAERAVDCAPTANTGAVLGAFGTGGGGGNEPDA